jgi:hypothetical protein
MEFHAFDNGKRFGIFFVYFSFGGFALLVEFEEYFGIIYMGFRIAVLIYPVFVCFEFFEDAFGPLGVIPKCRIE